MSTRGQSCSGFLNHEVKGHIPGTARPSAARSAHPHRAREAGAPAQPGDSQASSLQEGSEFLGGLSHCGSGVLCHKQLSPTLTHTTCHLTH